MYFSIGIPVYKSRFLDECIKSVLRQTFLDFEVIILNDCSPEPVEEIVLGFSDQRIIYLKNEVNWGAERLVETWNRCLSIAKGDFFVMMGDDDVMTVDFLTEFKALIEKFPGLDVYHCRSNIIDEHSKKVKVAPSWPEFESVYDNIWHRIKGYRSQFVTDFVYRTESLKRVGGYYFTPLAWAADDITAYIAASNKGIAHTNKAIFNYRETGYTISSTGSYKLKMDAVFIEDEWLSNFLKIIPTNSQDITVFNDIIVIKEIYFFNKRRNIIVKSLKAQRIKSFCFWFTNRKKYNLSVAALCRFFVSSLKNN